MSVPFIKQRYIAVTLFLLSSVVLFWSSDTKSQSTKVAVVDRNLITRDSLAAKGMRNLIEQRYQRYQAEIKEAQNALEKASEDLKIRSAQLSADQLKERRAEIRQQATELSRILQSRKSELDQMFNRGMTQIDSVLNTVLKKMAREQGINLIINANKSRRNVLFIDADLLLTNEALGRLNKILPKIELATTPSPIKK